MPIRPASNPGNPPASLGSSAAAPSDPEAHARVADGFEQLRGREPVGTSQPPGPGAPASDKLARAAPNPSARMEGLPDELAQQMWDLLPPADLPAVADTSKTLRASLAQRPLPPPNAEALIAANDLYALGHYVATHVINPRGRAADGVPLFFLVAARGHAQLIARFMANGANSFERDRTGLSAWDWAAAFGHTTLVPGNVRNVVAPPADLAALKAAGHPKAVHGLHLAYWSRAEPMDEPSLIACMRESEHVGYHLLQLARAGAFPDLSAEGCRKLSELIRFYARDSGDDMRAALRLLATFTEQGTKP